MDRTQSTHYKNSMFGRTDMSNVGPSDRIDLIEQLDEPRQSAEISLANLTIIVILLTSTFRITIYLERLVFPVEDKAGIIGAHY